MEPFRIGFGYDVHPLKEGARFVLGGVVIAHHKGSSGHSDADVLIHAIMDALLGACGLGDIGQHFPDADPSLKNADSRQLLKKCMKMVRERGYELLNLDTTVCLQTPQITNHIPDMIRTLSDVMQVKPSQVSVKATTTEKLGFVGMEQGLSAYAVVMVKAIV